MKKLLTLLLTFCLCFNCVSYKYGAKGETSESSNLTFGIVKSKIIKGKTNQNEILRLFGSPNIVTKNKSNSEVWSYNKMSVVKKRGQTSFLSGGFVIIGSGGRSSSSSSTKSFDLIITFNDNDTVNEYSVVSTKF
jgi:hypothetical protein